MLGAGLGPSRGAPLWSRPGIVGPRFPGPLPVWLPLLRLEEGGCVRVQRGGARLGGEGVVDLVCPPNGVASLGVAVRGLGLGMLDG